MYPGILVLNVLFDPFLWAEIGMSHFEFNLSQKMNYFSDLKLDCSIHGGRGGVIQRSTVSVSIFGFKISITLIGHKAGEPSLLSCSLCFCMSTFSVPITWQKREFLLIVLVLLVDIAFLFESQDLWNNKCHSMLCAILNSS